ncbi:TetR/AcrR family transcriptional regulator, partial [Salmonella enterica]|uniref:TetR/AcrR family transcriptional regulator n=1 Tax=Salmonella enterica TaxID=28901 RepID=UPI00398C3CE1
MNQQNDPDTREQPLATCEQLCIQRGFTGMGLRELLKTAQVPHGSFYHYFRSKEAFGVAILERHYACYHQPLTPPFPPGPGNHRPRLLAWYQETLKPFCQQASLTAYLPLKLSPESSTFTQDIRAPMYKG